MQASRRTTLGRLVLKGGPLGLSAVRPTGLAYSPERRLLAVANRSGGVHLVAFREGSDAVRVAPAPLASVGQGTLKR